MKNERRENLLKISAYVLIAIIMGTIWGTKGLGETEALGMYIYVAVIGVIDLFITNKKRMAEACETTEKFYLK